MEKIRLLDKSDIDLRVGYISEKGCTLLLYKTARVDMEILDERVGEFGWQRDHKELKGNIYCGIGIFKNDKWIWKWDAGAETQVEKSKGEASDSFKRAGVNWGIGRELYTAPFTWINLEKGETYQKNNKTQLDKKVKFKVKEIGYTDRKITSLVVVDQTNKVRFKMGEYVEPPKVDIPKVEMINAIQLAAIVDWGSAGKPLAKALKYYKVTKAKELNEKQAKAIIEKWGENESNK